MKKNTIIFALLFSCFSLLLYFSSFAQSYKPCLDGEITRWSFVDQHTSAPVAQSSDIVAFGDTILNDKTYKKLYIDHTHYYDKDLDMEENNINWIDHVPQLYYQWEGFFIRESEDAAKLYIFSTRDNEEYLISDINLQEGDILNNYCESIVDSVYFENGLKHVRWHHLYNSYTCNKDRQYVFIESVGSDMWFVYPKGFSDCWGLNCFQNQTTFYKNNRNTNGHDFPNWPCGYEDDRVGINSISENDYSVFIQKGQIEIFFDSNIHADIFIYDMQGKLCYTNDTSNRNVIISTASLPKGIYILNILNKDNNRISSKKIVIQ